MDVCLQRPGRAHPPDRCQDPGHDHGLRPAGPHDHEDGGRPGFELVLRHLPGRRCVPEGYREALPGLGQQRLWQDL
ncbi:MAG: hypothetical protein WAO95_04735 [Burkholderiales bacterium]